MKKFLFILVALVCSINLNAQVLKVMKDGNIVAKFTADQAEQFVFEEKTDEPVYEVYYGYESGERFVYPEDRIIEQKDVEKITWSDLKKAEYLVPVKEYSSLSVEELCIPELGWNILGFVCVLNTIEATPVLTDIFGGIGDFNFVTNIMINGREYKLYCKNLDVAGFEADVMFKFDYKK